MKNLNFNGLESGIPSSPIEIPEPKGFANQLLTPDEWFRKHYYGNYEKEIPARMLEKLSEKELESLKAIYGNRTKDDLMREISEQPFAD